MVRFDDLQVFVRAADLGSLSAAARVMDMSPAVASAALKRLEAQLSARLLARSTRSLRLTAEGQGFLDYRARHWAAWRKGGGFCPVGRIRSVGCCNSRRLQTSGEMSCCPGLMSFSVSIRN